MTPVTPSNSSYPEDWWNIGTMMGTWLSAMVVIWRNRVIDRRKYNQQLHERFDKIENQTKEDHTAVKVQIEDLRSTVSENYLSKSEVNTIFLSIQETTNGLRSDIRHLTDRLDNFISRRRPGDDG